MSAPEPAVFEVLRRIRMDLTDAQMKVTEALNMLSAMNLPVKAPENVCPQCGHGFYGERELAFHLANVHGGPAVPLSEIEEEAA